MYSSLKLCNSVRTFNFILPKFNIPKITGASPLSKRFPEYKNLQLYLRYDFPEPPGHPPPDTETARFQHPPSDTLRGHTAPFHDIVY